MSFLNPTQWVLRKGVFVRGGNQEVVCTYSSFEEFEAVYETINRPSSIVQDGFTLFREGIP
jgi:hypothetical protein